MSAPSTGTVVVAVGQLRADADSWSHAAAEHATIAGWLAGAALAQLEFGPIGRLRADFEAARVQMERTVAAGGIAAATIAATITDAADAYLRDEIKNLHAAEQIW